MKNRTKTVVVNCKYQDRLRIRIDHDRDIRVLTCPEGANDFFLTSKGARKLAATLLDLADKRDGMMKR